MQSGLDLDKNGSLEPLEITGTSFVCNGVGGAPGAAAIANLVRTTPEPAGGNCATGGQRIQSGADTSGNGTLEPAEVTQTSFACNGTTGLTGTPGAPGAVGGAGFNSLILTSPEAAGANCPAGGLKVESGLDTSRDGSLQNAEVTATSYICRLPSAVIKTWGEAALIEAGALDALNPRVKFDANGNAIAVWQQTDGTRFNIWANRYTKRDGWGTAALIETDNAGGAFGPQIAIDANGNAIAVWTQFDGTRVNIWANRYSPGSGWGTAALIETDNAGGAFGPQIEIDANGNAIAVWYQFDGVRSNIVFNDYR